MPFPSKIIGPSALDLLHLDASEIPRITGDVNSPCLWKGNDPIGDTPIFQGTMIMGGRGNTEINYMLETTGVGLLPSKGSPLWWFFPIFLPNVKANFCWINLLPVKKRAGDFKNCQEGFQNLRAAEIKHGRVPGI